MTGTRQISNSRVGGVGRKRARAMRLAHQMTLIRAGVPGGTRSSQEETHRAH